jgi:hypothetical protein
LFLVAVGGADWGVVGGLEEDWAGFEDLGFRVSRRALKLGPWRCKI